MLSGCVSVPTQLTRQEYLDMVSRRYDAPPEQVIAAAEKLLTLADGKDFRFGHRPEGFTAHRHYVIYAVIAADSTTDMWDVTVRPSGSGSGSEVTIVVRGMSQALAGTVTPVIGGGGGMGISVTSISANAEPPSQSLALYGLIWTRMDYLLGRRADWVTCKQAREQRKAGDTKGDLSQRCLQTKDRAPDHAAAG